MVYIKSKASEALIPSILSSFNEKIIVESVAILFGIALISILARVIIPLPWTPVPITGQTFGVTLVALSWGRKRSFAVLVGYLLFGIAGAPVFAFGKSGLLLGPTSGYLVGMLVASLIVGHMADRGFTKTLTRTFYAAFCGSVIVFACGLIGLSFFIPFKMLLIAGFFPFLLGDIIKTGLASVISWKINQFSQLKR